MYTIEEAEQMLEEVADNLPVDIFDGLNGGICLLEESKLHPDSVPGYPLYVLGEYQRKPFLGAFINIYYGSFLRVFGSLPREQFQEELDRTLRHEFRHHLEWRAGDRTLEEEDIQRLYEYQRRIDNPD